MGNPEILADLMGELRRHARATARLLERLDGRVGEAREGGPGGRATSRPLATPLLQEPERVRELVRERVAGLEGRGVTTLDLCDALGVVEVERGMATRERLGRELRALGWAPVGPRRGPTRERVYRPRAATPG